MLPPNGVAAWKRAGQMVYDTFGSRVMAARLNMVDKDRVDVNIHLVSAYAPVGRAPQREWDCFFAALDACIASKQNGDILLIGI